MTSSEPNDRAAQALAHHFRLVIDNDEPSYHWQRALTSRAILGAHAYLDDPDNEGSPLTVDDIAVSDLADSLKDWAEDMCGLEDMPHGLLSELLTTALGHVDWRALAAAYIAEFRES